MWPVLSMLLLASGTDYDRGVALFEQGKPAAAIEFLERAAKAEPTQPLTWKALGVAYAAQGLYALAEPPLQKACVLAPKLEDACYFHARTLYALDRFEASLEILHRAPESWKVALAQAQALEGLGQASEAERHFQKSRLLAHNAVAQTEAAYGLFLVRQGRSKEAIPLLEDTLSRFPADADSQIHLGRALLEQDRFGDAAVYLEQALKTHPGSTQAHLLLAKAYIRSGRAADAKPHLAAAQK